MDTADFRPEIKTGPPAVLVTNLDTIPSEYFKVQEPKLDKREVLKELKNGTEIAGAEIVRNEKLKF
jgi:hypothetical protein